MNENQSPPLKKTEQKENTKMEDYNVESVIQKILNGKETWTIDENMPLLVQELDNLKTDLKMFLENCDFDIPALLREAADLCAESTDLVEEMTACKTEIEQETMAEIRKSIESHDKTAKDLEKVNFAIDIVSDIAMCETYLKSFEQGREGESYSMMVESICNMLEHINHPADGFQQLDLYTQFRTYGNLLLDKLCQALNQEWDKMISYSVTPGSQKTVITLHIAVNDNRKSFDVISALKSCKKFTEKLAEFSIFMLKEVFAPVVKNESTMTVDSDDQLTITIHHSKSNSRPKHSDVIPKMRLLFNFIHDRFNVVMSHSLMEMFGELICIDFCNIMVNDCFIHTVPTNINDLQSYSWITLEIEAFQHFLMRLKVFPDEGLSLLSYMENIDVLFADSSSRHFLETARTIMLKDLSVTMSIGHEEIPEDTSNTSGAEKTSDPQNTTQTTTDEALDIFAKTIPKSLFYFPRCLISKTAQELLDLVYVIMEQAVQCPDIVCKKLYQAVRLIFELYDAIVPYHHENYLQTIPQYVALFHNNCMYLAHNLQTLGDKWLTLMEGRELDYAIGFVDLVQKIRELGYKHLTMHMQQQRKQILDNIRSSDLNCIVTKDVLGDNAEAAVRQCLRQLQLLKNVWIGVFPANVFTKLMATLVNMFLDELIHRVCTVEDISVEMATQLADMYTLVIQKTPQLFTAPSDVDKYVKSWTKLQELIFVLGGSLKDIENHWNDGTGPLAVHFQVDELRSLIKALFQNTQFRANLLSKIK